MYQFLLFFCFFTACSNSSNRLQNSALAQLQSTFKSWLGTPNPDPSPSSSLSEEYTSTKAQDAKVHSELLREMLFVVLEKEPKNHVFFGNWLDTLNQGASLEGVYNGIVHSEDYRKLELVSPAASPDTLKAFGEELAYLEIEFPKPAEFDDLHALILPPTADAPAPSLLDVDAPRTLKSAQLAPSANNNLFPAEIPSSSPSFNPEVWKKLADNYSKKLVSNSLFVLKRILGDEALKVLELKNNYPENLAFWYARWVLRIIKTYPIDFGIAERNRTDYDFHYHWALKTKRDIVRWEVLNRLHRILNTADQPKP